PTGFTHAVDAASVGFIAQGARDPLPTARKWPIRDRCAVRSVDRRTAPITGPAYPAKAGPGPSSGPRPLRTAMRLSHDPPFFPACPAFAPAQSGRYFERTGWPARLRRSATAQARRIATQRQAALRTA